MHHVPKNTNEFDILYNVSSVHCKNQYKYRIIFTATKYFQNLFQVQGECLNNVCSSVRGQPNYTGVLGTVRSIVANEGPK